MTDLVVDGGFELSTASPQNLTWSQSQVGGLGTFVSEPPGVPFGITPPHSGIRSVCLICSDGGISSPPRTRSIFQDITLPNRVGITLSFWYGLTRVFSHGTAKCEIMDTSNNVLATLFSQNSGTLVTPSWTQFQASMDAFAGQTIRLAFSLTITFANVGNVFFSLDDIQMLVPDRKRRTTAFVS